jgi:hypothetical protein
MGKRFNYGLLKSDYNIDINRLNWDYIKGIIDPDGHIATNIHKNGYRIVITQYHQNFIKEIKKFIDNSFNTDGKIYINGTQINFYDKDFYNFIVNYKIINFDSYYAGIIDGDGSFCTHTCSSGTYWRFCLGATKERKIIIFKQLFDYYNLKPIIWISKSKNLLHKDCIMLGVQRYDELIFLLEKLNKKLIIKQFIGDKVLEELKGFEKKQYIICKYCGILFKKEIGRCKQFCCKSIECNKQMWKDNYLKHKKEQIKRQSEKRRKNRELSIFLSNFFNY